MNLNLPNIEVVSSKVHEAWMQSKLAQGVTTRRAENGEEMMVPYDQLSEACKDLDRGTVQAVYRAINAASGPLLTFGAAIEALKAGKRVARAGWNGKGMYLWLLPAAMVKSEWCREPHLKAVADANGGEIEALGSIRMMTADKKVLTDWLASQTDMLAEDWRIVE